jgi:hypothetical protein
MTMTLIETKTLGTAAASIEFTSIPQDGTDLYFLFSLRASADASNWTLSFNASSSNFTTLQVFGNGASGSATSAANSGQAYGAVNPSTATADTFANATMIIPNYSGATNKSYNVTGVSENNGTTAFQTVSAGLWSQTAAITSVKFEVSGGSNFTIGSTISLYKITKGSGGVVVS